MISTEIRLSRNDAAVITQLPKRQCVPACQYRDPITSSSTGESNTRHSASLALGHLGSGKMCDSTTAFSNVARNGLAFGEGAPGLNLRDYRVANSRASLKDCDSDRRYVVKTFRQFRLPSARFSLPVKFTHVPRAPARSLLCRSSARSRLRAHSRGRPCHLRCASPSLR